MASPRVWVTSALSATTSDGVLSSQKKRGSFRKVSPFLFFVSCLLLLEVEGDGGVVGLTGIRHAAREGEGVVAHLLVGLDGEGGLAALVFEHFLVAVPGIAQLACLLIFPVPHADEDLAVLEEDDERARLGEHDVRNIHLLRDIGIQLGCLLLGVGEDGVETGGIGSLENLGGLHGAVKGNVRVANFPVTTEILREVAVRDFLDDFNGVGDSLVDIAVQE